MEKKRLSNLTFPITGLPCINKDAYSSVPMDAAGIITKVGVNCIAEFDGERYYYDAQDFIDHRVELADVEMNKAVVSQLIRM